MEKKMEKRNMFKTIKKKVNEFVESITYEEEEMILDNGLDEDYDNSTMTVAKINEPLKTEPVVKETEELNSTSEPKVKTLLSRKAPKKEDVEEHEHQSVMDKLKSTPVTVEVVDEESGLSSFPIYEKKENAQYEKAVINVEDVTEELTEEQKIAEIFYQKMDFRDEKIVGFKDTFYDVVQLIENSEIFSRDRKIEKIKELEVEFFNVDDDNDGSIYMFYTKISHEYHMAKNSLGEYNAEIYNDPKLQIDYLLRYEMSKLYADDNLYTCLLEEDKKLLNEIGDLYETLLNKMYNYKLLNAEKSKQKEYIDYFSAIVSGSDNHCEALNVKYILENAIYDIDNKQGRFQSSSILSLA